MNKCELLIKQLKESGADNLPTLDILSEFLKGIEEKNTVTLDASAYEDLLSEFSRLAQSYSFLEDATKCCEEAELPHELSPILGILSNETTRCYNHFAEVGMLLFKGHVFDKLPDFSKNFSKRLYEKINEKEKGEKYE